MATLGALKDEIVADFGSTAGTPTAVQIRAKINDAIRFHKRKRFWFNTVSETLTLTADSPTVPATSVTKLYELTPAGLAVVVNDIKYTLTKITAEDYDAMDFGSSGIPCVYTEKEGTLVVYPYPQEAYSLVIRFVRDITDFTTATDADDSTSNVWTTNAELLVKDTALMYIYASIKRDQKGMAQIYTAKVVDDLKELRAINYRRVGKSEVEIIQI